MGQGKDCLDAGRPGGEGGLGLFCEITRMISLEIRTGTRKQCFLALEGKDRKSVIAMITEGLWKSGRGGATRRARSGS